MLNFRFDYANGVAIYFDDPSQWYKSNRRGVAFKKCGHMCYRLETKAGSKCCSCGPGTIKRAGQPRVALLPCQACGGTKVAGTHASY